jgi:hypothetical protein
VTAIEGDHGSTYLHPESGAAEVATLDAFRVSPRMVYVDASRPDLVEAFTRRTFTATVEGVREPAIAAGLIAPERFDAGIRDLHRTTEPDGVFCHTFSKGVGERIGAARGPS